MINSYVMVTRPEPEADDYANQLEGLGYRVLAEPMLEIVPRDFPKPDPEKYDGLIFTSGQAVRIFGSAEGFLSLPVFAVGGHTSEVARELGYKNVISGEGDGQKLAELIGSVIGDTAKRLLHPRGEDVAAPMEELLKTSKVGVESIVVYKAAFVRQLSKRAIDTINAGEVEAVTLFSKRSAENFVRLILENNLRAKLAGIKALCLSQAVLECAQSCDWLNTYSAETPDGQGMTDLVTRHCSGNFTRKVKTL